jgi:hypothetical protein
VKQQWAWGIADVDRSNSRGGREALRDGEVGRVSIDAKGYDWSNLGIVGRGGRV